MFNVQCLKCSMFNVQCSMFKMFNHKLTYHPLMSLDNLAVKALSVLLLSAALTSCQKELCYDHNHGGRSALHVNFDWSAYPEAEPTEMSLMIFAEGSQPVQIPFKGKEGGDISLAEGSYGLIGYNNDTELQTRGRDWGDFEIYSQASELNTFSRMFASTRNIPRSRGTESQPVIYEPDSLWTSALNDVTVSETSWGQTVIMPMKTANTFFSFVIDNVDNLDLVTELAGTLSGMSGSWYPATEMPSDDECIIPFPLEKTGETSIGGYMNSFGHCPNPDAPHEHHLVVYVEMNNISKYYYSVDVTEKVHEVWNGGVIHIERLPLPLPVSGGGGFNPGIDEWNEVHIDIDLGE